MSPSLTAIEPAGWPTPPSVATVVIDAVLELSTALLPMPNTSTAMHIVLEAIDALHSLKLERNIARRAVVNMNLCVALVLVLRGVMISINASKEAFNNEKVQDRIVGLLSVSLKINFVYYRIH